MFSYLRSSRVALFGVALVASVFSAARLPAAVTIKPVPVWPNGNQTYLKANAYDVRVEDAANSANSFLLETHVHKVQYHRANPPGPLLSPPADPNNPDLITNAYYTHFSFGGGPVKVTITLNKLQETVPANYYSWKLSPTSYGLSVTQDATKHNVLSFTLSNSRYLMLKITDPDKFYPAYLLIMADDLEAGAPTSPGTQGAGGIWDVTKAPFNADPTNAASCVTAFNNAMAQASNPPGGTVFVPPGIYKIDATLQATSNCNVYLSPGAYLRVPDNLVRAAGFTKIYLFQGLGIHDFKLFGRGTLDCNGIAAGGHLNSNRDPGDHLPFVYANGVQSMGVRMDDCQRITLDGVVMRESTGWMIHQDRNDPVILSNLKVVNYIQDFRNYREDDGLDLVQCHNSSVTHCMVFCADDSVCLKGSDGFDSAPWMGVDNCIYYDLVVRSGADGCKFGMQAQSAITNSSFQNIDIVEAARAIAVHVTGGTAPYQNISFSQIRCENVTSQPVDFDIKSPATTAVTNVTVTDFLFTNFASGSIVHGDNGSFSTVKFINMQCPANTVLLDKTAAHMNVDTKATGVTFSSSAPDSNLLIPNGTPLTPTLPSSSGNWKTSGSSVYLINDGSTANEGQVTDFNDAWVVYNFVQNRTITSAKINQDGLNFSVQSWKMERWDLVTHEWVEVFGWTPSLAAGWTTKTFAPVLGTGVRIWFHPAATKQVGVNEVEIYGH